MEVQITLPCSVGDVLYCVKDNSIIELTVSCFTVLKDKICIECNGGYSVFTNQVGKDVFLNKEDAMLLVPTIDFEEKYLVFKRSDISAYLNDDDKEKLHCFVQKISKARNIHGKKDNEYLVINTDEIFIKEIAKIMKEYDCYTPGGKIKIIE